MSSYDFEEFELHSSFTVVVLCSNIVLITGMHATCQFHTLVIIE